MPPPDAADPSKLPEEDPDFEPEAYCPPKILFPEAHAKLRRKRRSAAKAAERESHGEETHESDAEEEPVVGKGKGKAVRTSAAGVLSVGSTSEAVQSKAKGRSSAKKAAKADPSEWDTTDEEDGGGDEEVFTPPGRIPLPRDFVPAPKPSKAQEHPLPKVEEEPEPEPEPEAEAEQEKAPTLSQPEAHLSAPVEPEEPKETMFSAPAKPVKVVPSAVADPEDGADEAAEADDEVAPLPPPKFTSRASPPIASRTRSRTRSPEPARVAEPKVPTKEKRESPRHTTGVRGRSRAVKR